MNTGEEVRATATPAVSVTDTRTRIGKYEVRAEIGQGTLVKVFRAADLDTGRQVILKLLVPSRERRLVELFRREVANAARLRHRNFITIYELGEHAGSAFAAMQDLDGRELRGGAEAPRPLTLLEKVTIMSQVAEGLRAAHQGGLSYVGIRPSGIVLAGDGSAVIQDFSIVRLIGEEQDEDLSYAAPEELQDGTLPDALCDIFSFGVIYHELLAGTRPGGNGGPGALRAAVPECPEALERLIGRACDQNRDRRYRSMEDVQDIAEPILCELKRARAGALLSEARRLQASGQLEQAQTAVREMLELDPANRKAHQIQAGLRAECRRRELEERLRALFREADEEAAARRFARAVEVLHMAVQLEGSPPQAAERLEEMCGRLERSQNAAQLLADARQLLVEGSFPEALAKASKARGLDPDRPETDDLLGAISDAVECRQREVRLEADLAKANGMLQEQGYSGAIALLLGLRAEYPDSSAVALCLAQAEAGSLMAAGRFSDAAEKLAPLAGQFPSDASLTRLLQQAHEAIQRAAAARQALEEAQWLLDQDRPHLAVRFLREKSAELPGQPELQARMEAIERMIPEWENRRFVQDCLARATAMEQGEHWVAALALIEQALETSPSSHELQATADRLRSRKREEERRKKLARRLEAIQQKLGAEAWTEALSLVEFALEEFPGDPELAPLEAQARTGRQRAECEALVADVRQELAAGEPEKAEALLRKRMEFLHGEPVLEALWEELQAGKHYREQCRAAQALFARRRLREAEEILAPLAIYGHPEAQALLETVRTARAASEEGDFYDQAREQALKLIVQGQFAQAADLLRNMLNLFPADPVLERDLQRAQAGLQDVEVKACAELTEPPVEPSPEVPAEPAPELAPRIEPSRRRAFLPYMLWPAVGASVLLFLGTAGGTLWKLSRREAHAAVPPPKPAAQQQPSAVKASPLVPQSEAGATDQPLRVQAKPASIAPRQPFTPPGFAADPNRNQTVVLPAPAAEVAPAGHDAPRLPAEPGQIAPPPAPVEKPAERSAQLAARNPQPAPPVILEPKPISHPPPRTPELALQHGISGEVRLEATVSPRGTVMQVKVLSGDPILSVAAKAAVWRWRYEPGTINGRPAPMNVQILVVFEKRNR